MVNEQHPVSGSGANGAVGPAKIASVRAIREQAESINEGEMSDAQIGIDRSAHLSITPGNEIASSGASYVAGGLGSMMSTPQGFPSRAAAGPHGAMDIIQGGAFTSTDDIDLPGATSGSYIISFSGGYFYVYNLGGAVVKQIPSASLICGASGSLPICANNPALADPRVVYDTWSNRWVASGMMKSSGAPTDVVAVSQTSDPTGGWYAYQFPPCGSSYPSVNWDQPHLGFNNQWIVVDTACDTNYPGLAVFDKNALYSGAGLSLNANWFEFNDPAEWNNKDNPTRTYVATVNNREYLTASYPGNCNTIGGTCVNEVYSHIEGATDSPVFYASTDTMKTDFPWGDSYQVHVSTPTCSACLHTYSSNWTHSSSVYHFTDGHAYILSTAVFGDPAYSNGNQVVSFAMSDAGTAKSIRIEGGANAGPLTSEIAMPLSPNLSSNEAIFAYDWSSPSFYPGVWASQWNIDLNRLDFTNVLVQGTTTPNTAFYQGRWSDFLDAMSPIPGSSALLVGAHRASPSATESTQSSYWTTLTEGTPAPVSTPVSSPTPRPTLDPCLRNPRLCL